MPGVMGVLDRIVGWLGPDRPFPERAGLFAAAAVVGPSFEPGLQPRRTVDQAIATGVISAVTLNGVTAAQSAIEALARIATRDRADHSSALARWAIAVGANGAVAAAAMAVASALPPREDERLRRGMVRTAAERTMRVAALSTGLATATWLAESVAERDSERRWLSRIPVALPAGVAVAAWKINRVHRRARAAGDETITDVSTGSSVGLAVAVGAGVLALQAGEGLIARGVASTVVAVTPRYEPIATAIGHLVSLGLLGAGIAAGYEYAVRNVEQGGAAIEPAYGRAARSPLVSGGPGSVVDFESLSREGRRFVNMVLTGEEIERVMGEPARAEPIRLFVGLDSAAEVEDRVDLVMDELVRTKAFERDVLVFASPTGSGYINYVLAESVEFFARGSSAIVTMQYSLRPSFLSLDRSAIAVEQNRALMHAITGYLRGVPEERRPRFVLFGESLGAQTMLDIYRHRTSEAIDRDFVHASLFLGTPAGSDFARAWRIDPGRVDPPGTLVELDGYGDYRTLPDERRDAVRHVLISHYDDPIPKFGPSLLVRRPWWLGPPEQRPPRVPRSATWRPATTFVLTAVDLINAMEVVPGRFGRRGHDYREDIARFVSTVYDLPVTAPQLEAAERAMRSRELAWAEKRVVTEQVARAREAVLREVKSWGVASGDGGDAALSFLDGLLTNAALASSPGTP